MDQELRILVVDDDRGCRELHALCFDDHAVETAVDGQEALETLDERVDIVLLDRNMPRLSGTDVARAIDESDHDPYVVMISSMEADFDLSEFPVDGYLRKPASEEELQGIVDQYRSEQAHGQALDASFGMTPEAAEAETRKSDADLAQSGECVHLEERVTEKRAEVDERSGATCADRVVTFRT